MEPTEVDRPRQDPVADVDEIDDPAHAAADAATLASRDAETAARSAADTTLAAQEAVVAASAVATSARKATATTVAAAAAAAADIAARAATAVEAEAVARALDVAAQAVVALEKIAADLPDDVDPDGARRIAALVAATVAADVIAQAKSTADAASMVAAAVTLAAEAAAIAAAAAAAVVDQAAGTAQAHAHVVVGQSAATQAASGLAVESSSRVSTLAQDRLAMLHQTPLVIELQGALADADLRLHYQPMYDMKTGALVAVEALLRWQHPSRGLLPPATFLEVAEGHLLITPIGDWVLATAVDQALEWKRLVGEHSPTMWVNISCNQLGKRHLIGLIEDLLAASGLAPEKLGLEVTERQLASSADDVAMDLLALHDLGVNLAVDDFGTGYASLDYLRRFIFDEIKIDRSFVSGVGQDKTDTAVTASIIALGRSLDLTVVAEGVETQDQYDLLRDFGCDLSQGYLLQRPAPSEVVSQLLLPATVGR